MNLAEEIELTVDLLRKGKIILYPTDTIWGIGCDATNSKAVQRIFKIKGRNQTKSMIILLNSVEQLPHYVKKIPPTAYDLINNSIRPLTIVYPGAKNISRKLIATDGTIAIRIVKGRFTSGVIGQLGKPLVSTSANLSGEPSPVLFSEISERLKSEVDYVVEHFRNKAKTLRPSTIIKIEESGKFTVLRP